MGCFNTFILDIECPKCGKLHKNFELQTKDFNHLTVQEYFELNDNIYKYLRLPRHTISFLGFFSCDAFINHHNENDIPFCKYSCDMIGYIRDNIFKGVLTNKDGKIITLEYPLSLYPKKK